MARFVKSPVGYEQITVSTVAVALASVPPKATNALIVVSTNGVRFRDDGTNPTAAIGVPIAAGQSLQYDGDPSALKFIRSGAADAVVDVSYYEGP